MAPARILERNVKVPKSVPEVEVREDEYEGLPEDGSDQEEGSSSEIEIESDIEEEVEQDESGGDVVGKISSVSFGALKKAQDTLSRKRKRVSDEAPEQDDKLEALRKRLKQIKEQKGARLTTRPTQIASDDEDDSESESESAPSEEGDSKSRTSKHAPASQTSRHQVTRKRVVIDVPKRIIRDPRFDNIPSQPQSYSSSAPATGDKAYGFLRDYQRNEIAELKSALKRRGITEDEVYNLRRKINSMENRLKTHAAKEREQIVRSAHRKEEKERVREGKKPYYLKEKDIKERALVEKYKGMKGKEREKLVQKRALKDSQKEKRRMPRDRRLNG